MTQPNDPVIAHARVKIHPDFAAFGKEMRLGMRRAVASDETIARAKEAAANMTRIRGMYLRQTFQQVRNYNEQVQRAETSAYNERFKRLRSFHEGVQRDEQAAYNTRFSRVRSFGERVAQETRRAETQAYAEGATRLKAANAAQEKELKAAAARRGQILGNAKSAFGGPAIIDWGAKGIRPMNLLYLSVAALSPALIAMGSNAVAAGTSVAALGSAAYGGSLAIVGLTQAFAGVIGAVKLHTQMLKSQQGQSVKAAKSELDNAASVRHAWESVIDARDAVTDASARLKKAQRDEKDAVKGVTAAYVEARQKARDLREELSDLYLQLSGGNLDVAAAQKKLADVTNNFFADPLEVEQAKQELRERVEAVNDTKDAIKKTNAEMAKTPANPGKSQGVIDAQRQATDATEARKKAERDLADAQRNAKNSQLDYNDALKGGTAATTANVAAAGQLDAALKDLSPAGREMYHWLIDNTELFKRLRRRMETAILPGFLTFLQQISKRGKDGKSTLDVLTDGAAAVGESIGRTTAALGYIFQSKWFKGALKKLNKDNAKSFDNVGVAATGLVRPITRIITAASPLMVRFSNYLLTVADKFSGWVSTLSDKDLAKWFKDAGDRLSDWWSIAVDVGRIVLSIFQASLPSGDNLVTRLKDFAGNLADLAESDTGRQKLKEFFDFFSKLNYGDLTQLAGSLGTLTVAINAFKLGSKHPFYLAMAILAAGFPSTTVSVLDGVSSALNGLMGLVVKYPAQAATILAILSGVKALSGMGKIPGLDKLLPQKLLNIFGDKGTTPLSPLYVYTVNGGTGLTPGKIPPVVPGVPRVPGAPKVGEAPDIVRGNEALAAIAALWELYGFYQDVHDKGWAKTITDKLKSYLPWEDARDKDRQAEEEARRRKKRRTGNGTFAAAPLPPALVATLGNEQWAYKILQGWEHTPGQSRTNALKDYIAARKKSVIDYVEYVRSTQGPIAAEVALRDENDKSVTTLQGVAKQMRLSKGDTEKYTQSINLVPKTAKTDVKTPGLPQANTDFATLKTRIDPVTGKKVITVSVNGQDKVFPTLHDAIVYQAALSLNLPMDKAAKKVSVWEAADLHGVYGHAATGGHIRGPGGPTGDKIPTMLSDFEYVQQAKSVRKYGVGFMDSVNDGRFPVQLARGFAAGGLVSGTWPMPYDVSTMAIPQPQLAPGQLVGDINVARIAEDTARGMHASTKQLIALFEAGLVESTMRNLNYGDRDSVGFLQQRPSAGWGTVKQLMNPAYATRKFINAAKRKDHKNQTAGQLAQAVQVSAYPGRYDQRYADAVALLNAEAPYVLGGGTIGPAAPPGAYGGSKAGLVAFGHYLQRLGYSVTENPAFGGVHGGHVSGSSHYRGSAIDVNHGAGTSALEQAFLSRIIPEAHRRGFRTLFMVPGHYNHAHIDLGPGRKMGGLVRAMASGGPVVEKESDKPTMGIEPWLRNPAKSMPASERLPFWLNFSDKQAAQYYQLRAGWKKDTAAQKKYMGLAGSTTGKTKKAQLLRQKYRTLAEEYGVKGRSDVAGLDNFNRAFLGQPAKVHAYDSGGVLKPGVTVAVNKTGKPETVRTHEQEQALRGGTQRLDRRDLALLAAYIANAIAGQHIRMDGRKVAETVRGYDYLPKGI